MNQPEFSRPIDSGRLGNGARRIQANPEEREALARRFGLVSIERLEATVTLDLQGETVAAQGQMIGEIVQSCAISSEDLPVSIKEPLFFRFVPAQDHTPDEEIELRKEDCDEIEFTGDSFDLGEAVAQSLALAIDPFATGPGANRVRKSSGLLDETDSSPFAALKALKEKKD